MENNVSGCLKIWAIVLVLILLLLMLVNCSSDSDSYEASSSYTVHSSSSGKKTTDYSYKTTTPSSKKSYDTYDGYDDGDGLKEGEYYCMGKNDTCPNKTYSPYDFFCSRCDPDGDNIEG